MRVIKSVPLYKDWGPIDRQEVVSNVEPGEKLKVLRIRYDKDLMAIKVEREKGPIGWILYYNFNQYKNSDSN